MLLKATTLFVCAVAAAALAGCGQPTIAGESRPDSSTGLSSRETAVDSEGRLVDLAWLRASEAALERPTVVELPYAEWGRFEVSEPAARAVAFAGSEGQVVRISLARPEEHDLPLIEIGEVRAELFVVESRSGARADVPLAEIEPGEHALWFRLPAAAEYVVRVQPEPLTTAPYRLAIELEAALRFPVKGRDSAAVASGFGMPRDQGTRHHEGVDIFAPRLTPVVAVADGRATPRENQLGGNTVWLSTPGTSYYYAHLERAAVEPGQRVKTGEVIGYVGNTGNAITTPPHLHFGIYRWGQGAIDPLPLLEAREFGTRDPRRGGAKLAREAPEPKCATRTHGAATSGCALELGGSLRGSGPHGCTAVNSARPSAASTRHAVIEAPLAFASALEPGRASPVDARVSRWAPAAPLTIDRGASRGVARVEIDTPAAIADDERALLDCVMSASTALDRAPLEERVTHHATTTF